MSVANPYFESFGKPSAKTADLAVLVFIKAPEPGACKTRLARNISAIRAARIYKTMAERTVAYAAQTVPGHVFLYCAPDTGHAFFQRLTRRYGVRRVQQSSGDLGSRMHRAFCDMLKRYPRVVLLGTDQPDLSGFPLDDAARVLSSDNTAWLAPTLDGGYWGIGLTRPHGPLFHGPAWSTSRVIATTRTRLRIAGFDWCEFERRRDVDTITDWQRLPRTLRRHLAIQALGRVVVR